MVRGGGGSGPVRNGHSPVEPIPFWPGSIPVPSAWFQPRRPKAVTQFRGGGGRLEVCLPPGGRRPPGPDDLGRLGMGDDFGEDKKKDRLLLSFFLFFF